MKTDKTSKQVIVSGEIREGQPAKGLQDRAMLISAYRTAEERGAVLAAIVESSDDAIISKDLNGIVTSWNKSAERIFGYSASEMIGASILKLIPWDRLNEETAILKKLRKGEQVEHFQTKRKRKDGNIIDVSLKISPVKSTDGRIIGVSKIARDVTDWMAAQNSSAILSAIIASTDDAIVSKDLNSMITSWNPAAERMFGYSASEMIGKSILKLIPQDRKEEEPIFLKKLKAGEKIEHYETKRLTKNGNLIEVSLTISPVRDVYNNIIGISKIARNITDRKLEEQRKNDFVAIVSHELKTPLTSLKGYIQLVLSMSKGDHDRARINLLERAKAQTQKMTTMIHEFLDLSKLEEGKMSMVFAEFSLCDLMDEVISEANVLAPNHIIKYKSNRDTNINGDFDKLCQVMINLISNAAKYSEKGSVITVAYELKNGLVCISVADQGIGIDEVEQRRLFERFYRADNANTKQVKGFGIGLYLASEIIKLHNSKITVRSNPGEGSEFSFCMPI